MKLLTRILLPWALALCAPLASVARAEVNLALTATESVVSPGALFDVVIEAHTGTTAFNGFDAVVGFSPALTLIQMTPLSMQEGAMMRNACATRFHHFSATASSASVTDVLMCSGASVSGDGQLYLMRFRAPQSVQECTVSLQPGTQLYQGGVSLGAVSPTSATIQVTAPTPTRRTAWGMLKALYHHR